MLNGKFFTGLPPKMIDKGCAARNRMESHLFWPDDSMLESAVETRVRRRNSVLESDRPVYGKQISVEANDVDTKKRFNKEFSQSSIQFCDNLKENNPTTRNRSQLQSRGMKKSELAEKPTATKLELPESVVDEAYTTAKKKQAYTSKIQFYDFVNEEDNTRSSRNNLRKPKMDMNDKREMELNSKNSPKLLMKRDVRSLSEEKEMPKLNNREVKTLERSSHIKEVNVNRIPVKEDYVRDDIHIRSNKNPKGNLASNNKSNVSQRDNYRMSERDNGREEVYRHSKEPNVSPKGDFFKTEPRNSNERDMYGKSNNSVLTRHGYENYREPQVYDNRRHSPRLDESPENFAEYPKYRTVGNDSKRYNNRSQYKYQDNRKYINDYEEEIGNRMKTVRIQQSPPRKRHQYYREEDHYEQADESPRYSRNSSSVADQTKRGNGQWHSDYNDSERYEADVPYVEKVEPIDRGRAKFNRVNNKLNNETHTRWDDYTPSESSFRNSAPTNPSRSATTNTSSSMDANSTQKHLRSSLCFHDGAIIAENDATRSPTSTQQSSQRRNARSSATKRVSVGLPD